MSTSLPRTRTTRRPTADRIAFKRHLRPELVADEATYLFAEQGVTALRCAHSEILTPLLDGSRTLEEVLDALPAHVPADECRAVIAKLTAAGLVGPRPAGSTDDPSLAFWDAAGLDSTTAARSVDGGRIRLLHTGGPAAEEAFTAAGLTVTDDPDADLSVVFCDDYLDPELAAIDADHRRRGRPWLPAKTTGTQLWIGPVFRPDTACWHCLADRLWNHRSAESHVQRTLGRTGPVERAVAAVAGLCDSGMQLAALEAAKWLAGHRYPGQDSIWILDGLSLQGRHHEVRRRPQCAECGRPGLMRDQAHRPVCLTSRPRKRAGGGGHRARSCDETWAEYRHLISPVTGIIKEIRRDGRASDFFNCYRSGPNVAATPGGLDGLRSALRAETGGKGATAREAEVGALCEAIERYSATFQGDEERVRASLRSLGPAAINPGDCMMFHARQYAQRAAWNRAHGRFQQVYEPFDPDAVMDWSPVWSLASNEERWLPTAMLYFGAPDEQGSVRADSNGNAAGSSLEDAVLQATLELIERDAAAIWWYNRTRMPGLDLDAFADPWLHELRDVYAETGREIWALDLTTDLGIPVVAALSRRRSGREAIMLGFGAHLDAGVALRRAFAELNQLMPALSANESFEQTDPDAARWFAEARTREQRYLLPDPGRPSRGPADFGHLSRNDLRDEVKLLQDRLGEQGLEPFVVDQTRPDIGLPVVKVIVPGLRHFWSRFGPGRLYDVPVRLGRQAEPTPYRRLNPFPLFL